MKRLVLCALVAAAATLTTSAQVAAHCEIPCGIYGDDLRFSMIMEDIQTIEKSMRQIDKLAGDAANANQLTRWVNNKEHHADRIREAVTQYFMVQRIKLPAEGDAAAVTAYRDRLALLHKMLVYAMKCKQTTDLENARHLHDAAHAFKKAYQS